MNELQRLFGSHREVVLFFAKMAAAYGVWFLLYDLWLLPDGRIDEALSHGVASATAGFLGLFSSGAVADGRTIWLGESAVFIEDGCNGLSALSLFVGFVLAYPGTWTRRAVFIPLGLLAVVLTNIGRCAFLLVVAEQWPAMFDAAHAFHALFVFYVVIFALWVVWANWGGSEGPRREAQPAIA